MEHILLVVHVFIAAALIGLVLLQRSESDGFGLGSGSGANLLSGRSAANLMTRLTAIVAGLFIINSLVLSVMAAHNRTPSIVEKIEQEQKADAFAPTKAKTTPETPVVPVVPLAGSAKKLNEPAVPTEEAKPAAKIKKPAPTKADLKTDETDTQN